MTKDLIIEVLDVEAEYKGLTFVTLSPYHLRVTDGVVFLDCWPSTGTYRAFNQKGSVKGLLLNGKFDKNHKDQDIIKVIETLWPTTLHKPKNK